MARPSSRVISALAILSLVTALGLAFFATPILAQGDDAGAGNDTAGNETAGNETADNATDGAGAGGAGGAGLDAFDYTVTVREDPDEAEAGHFAFDINAFSLPAGARVHLIYDSTGATGLHNAHPTEGAAEEPERGLQEGNPIAGDSGASSWMFTMPEEGEVTYVCDVHPQMVGTISVGAFGGGGGGAAGHGIVEEGVSFLAHWVGVIAFAMLFIMYGLTFFLFKYNETGFTTDHKDRATPAGAGVDVYGQDVRVSKGTAVVLALLLTALSIALVWAFVNGLLSFG